MEYDPKTVQLEIERTKAEMNELKKDDRSYSQLNAVLNSFQQKLEKLKEDKKLSEAILDDKLQAAKTRIQEAAYEKDKLEKDFYSLNNALKNVQIATEEVNELLFSRQEELGLLSRQVADSEETVRQKENERARLSKELDQANSERRDLKASFNKHEDDLRNNLKLAKDLEDEELNLDLSETKIRAEIAAMEKEMDELAKKEVILNQKLKTDEAEQERMTKYGQELAREVMEIRDLNEKHTGHKDDLIFKLKQESQKNIKLESTLRQYQMVHNASEESHNAIVEKLNQLEARIGQKSAERNHNQSMVEEDKRDLERAIKTSESQADYMLQVHDLHKNLAEKIEGHARSNRIAELKAEMLKIIQ